MAKPRQCGDRRCLCQAPVPSRNSTGKSCNQLDKSDKHLGAWSWGCCSAIRWVWQTGCCWRQRSAFHFCCEARFVSWGCWVIGWFPNVPRSDYSNQGWVKTQKVSRYSSCSENVHSKFSSGSVSIFFHLAYRLELRYGIWRVRMCGFWAYSCSCHQWGWQPSLSSLRPCVVEFKITWYHLSWKQI